MTTSNLSPSLETLDVQTGGVFNATNSSERIARVTAWLANGPSFEQLNEVFKELSSRDKGAAKAIKERIDEVRRVKQQESLSKEWQVKAEHLLGLEKLNLADALAWLRDAAKAGAPLSLEPLAKLKESLAQRIAGIEDLQRRIQIQNESAILLAQRTEVLSTKSWQIALSAKEGLEQDVNKWQTQASLLEQDANWLSIGAKFPSLLESSKAQLLAVWSAFNGALSQAVQASQDAANPLPAVRVWADEIAATRGPASDHQASDAQPGISAESRLHLTQNILSRIKQLELDVTEGHSKAGMASAHQLRIALKEGTKFIDDSLRERAAALLSKVSELSDWQRWRGDQLRQTLVKRAENLLRVGENGQQMPARKLQEVLRQLREEWRETDKGGVPNQALWKSFDDACSKAHAVVDEWQERAKAESGQHQVARQALIDELKTWTEQESGQVTSDWRKTNQALREFTERWRQAGHVGDKLFTELNALWKEALSKAYEPIEKLQELGAKELTDIVSEAEKIAKQAQSGARFSIDNVRALQKAWTEKVKAVPLDRKVEQKLWTAFRSHLDTAFESRTKNQTQSKEANYTQHDNNVLQAAQALKAACASGDAGAISVALSALNDVTQGKAVAAPSLPEVAAVTTGSGAENETAPDTAAIATETTQAADMAAPDAAPASPPVVKKVVAMRGDDRPGMGRSETPAPMNGRSAHGGGKEAKGRDRNRPDRADSRTATSLPRLADSVFHLQKEAQDEARAALRKLAQQAHGKSLEMLTKAWELRDGAGFPTVAEFAVKAVNASTRTAWLSSLEHKTPASMDAGAALLRLEVAAEVPTPAEFQSDRRALQLQLLARRNDPSPRETWVKDVANVLASPFDATSCARLTQCLKVFVR